MNDRLRELERSLEKQTPPTPGKPKSASARVGFYGGAGIVLVVTLTLLIGFQLGNFRWRFRREIWQLQGALAGGLAGYVVGWAVRGNRSRQEDA